MGSSGDAINRGKSTTVVDNVVTLPVNVASAKDGLTKHRHLGSGAVIAVKYSLEGAVR